MNWDENYKIRTHFIFLLLFLNSFAKAQTERLDNLAACSGVVLGNGAVDFFSGNEQSFDDAANDCSTYLLEVFAGGGYGQNDLR